MIDARQLTFTITATMRLQIFKEMLAEHKGRLIANPLDEEQAFIVRHLETIIEGLRDEVNNEWPEHIEV